MLNFAQYLKTICKMFTNVEDDVDVKGFKAVLPAVSYGNVGQLAVDLLIATSVDAKKIASFWHEGTLPIVGPNAFNDESLELTVTIEIFASERQKTVFIQIRSPILKTFQDNFKDEITNWMTNKGIKELIILASMYDLKKYVNQIEDPVSPRYLSTTADTLAKLSKDCVQLIEEEISDLKEDLGTALSMSILDYCLTLEIPVTLLMKYCAGEGDTTGYAETLAQYAASIFELLGLRKEDGVPLVRPPSWTQYTLYGNDLPESIYG